jgi:hypothetical protein
MKDGMRPLSRVRSKQQALIRWKEKVIRALKITCQIADGWPTPPLPRTWFRAFPLQIDRKQRADLSISKRLRCRHCLHM